MNLSKRLLSFRGVDMEQVSESLPELYKNAIRIAWPAVIEGALLSIINSIDTAMVGTLGSAAIAAVGLTAQPRMILLVMVQALCVGTTSVIARRKGEEDPIRANACLHQSLTIVTLLGLLMGILGYVFSVPLMYFSGANSDTIEMSAAYFRIICLALPFNSWALCICAGMRAIGQTKITMTTNITANLVNLVGNYLLIGGHFGAPALGVTGAAIATATGTVVSCLMAVQFACHRDGYLKLRFKSFFLFDKPTLKSLFSVGSSSAAESVFLRLGFLINNRLIAGIGTSAFAACQIVSQITSLSFTIGDGIATSGATMVGQSLGAKKEQTARAYVKVVRRLCLFASIILMILFFCLRNQMPRLFTTEPDVIHGCALAFIVVVFGVSPQNARVVYAGCLRGAGDAKYVAMCALISVAVIRPILTYVFCYPLNAAFPVFALSICGPWLSFDIDAYIREFLMAKRLKSDQWTKIKL